MYARRLLRLRREVETIDIIPSPDAVISSFDSKSGNERAKAFMVARRLIREGTPPEQFLEAAGTRLADPDPIARYEAGIVVSEAMPQHAERIWELLLASLSSTGREGRSDLGCLLLEELLNLNPDDYFMRCRREVSGQNFLILDALDVCYFDDFGPKWEAAQSFAFEARQQPRNRRGATQQVA